VLLSTLAVIPKVAVNVLIFATILDIVAAAVDPVTM
jgi:hypothetical protein